MTILNARGEPATHPVRMSIGFIPQQLPVETNTADGVRPPEVHAQEFYDAARAE